MTGTPNIRRLVRKIINNAEWIDARLDHATANLTLTANIGYPPTASGRPTNGGHATVDLTPTETAAHRNLGDLHGYDDNYRPGPTTRLNDLELELLAAINSIDRAHHEITAMGVPPMRHQTCVGINGEGCPHWQDNRRDDHRCTDHGRAIDSNARRRRRHATKRDYDPR